MCYTPDHAQASHMWSKPSEITAGWGANHYTGNGYENAAAGSLTPAQALDLWKSDAPHNDVIINAGIWANYNPWPALGCAINAGYAVMWFGDVADPQPYMP